MATILHSIYGRKLGVTKNGYVTGEVGAKFPGVHIGPSGSEVAIFGSTAVAAATSATTATNLTAGGINTIAASTVDDTWILGGAAAAGIPVVISRLTTSTATTGAINLSTGVTFLTSALSTGSIATWSGYGTLSLMSVSTAAYVVTAIHGGVALT